VLVAQQVCRTSFEGLKETRGKPQEGCKWIQEGSENVLLP
jgi:hypothetical protein